MRRFAIFWVTLFAKVFYHHKVYGKEHFPKGGGILAANHSSYLDPPLLGVSCPGEVHFLARETLFKPPPFAWLLRKLNTHPVKRGQGNAAAFRQAIDLITHGGKVVIFPEGRRSPTGEIQKGQLGLGILVQRTQCQVIPVYLHGTFEAWNNKTKFPRMKGRTVCVFGSPLHFSGFEAHEKKEIQAEIVQKVMDRIRELRAWYLAGAKESPP